MVKITQARWLMCINAANKVNYMSVHKNMNTVLIIYDLTALLLVVSELWLRAFSNAFLLLVGTLQLFLYYIL